MQNDATRQMWQSPELVELGNEGASEAKILDPLEAGPLGPS